MAGGQPTTGRDDRPVEIVIGMRWEQLWRLLTRPWVPLAFARMLVEPSRGGLCGTRLGVRPSGLVVQQRWRSRAAVDAWARDRGRSHAAPWGRFAREVGSISAWGLWHEVRPVSDPDD